VDSGVLVADGAGRVVAVATGVEVATGSGSEPPQPARLTPARTSSTRKVKGARDGNKATNVMCDSLES
jgi:hypothetical protein